MYNYIVAACHVQVNEVMILRHNHITFFYLCATNHMGKQFLIRKSDDVDNLVVRDYYLNNDQANMEIIYHLVCWD